MPVASAAAEMPAPAMPTAAMPATVMTSRMGRVASVVTSAVTSVVTAAVATVTTPVAPTTGQRRRGYEQASCDRCDETEFTWHLILLPLALRSQCSLLCEPLMN
jgi:hypothetical protein